VGILPCPGIFLSASVIILEVAAVVIVNCINIVFLVINFTDRVIGFDWFFLPWSFSF
jgi:hypothetical protein